MGTRMSAIAGAVMNASASAKSGVATGAKMVPAARTTVVTAEMFIQRSGEVLQRSVLPVRARNAIRAPEERVEGDFPFAVWA